MDTAVSTRQRRKAVQAPALMNKAARVSRPVPPCDFAQTKSLSINQQRSISPATFVPEMCLTDKL